MTDLLFIFPILATVLQLVRCEPGVSMCNEDFTVGTCVCILKNDRTQMIDLSALTKRDKPVVGYLDFEPGNDSLQYEFYMTFCQPITDMEKELPECNGISSVARNLVDICDVLGTPETTKFEARRISQDNPSIGFTMVTETTNNLRTVTYLHCDPSITEPILRPRPYSIGDKDHDGYHLYEIDLYGKDLCPVRSGLDPLPVTTARPENNVNNGGNSYSGELVGIEICLLLIVIAMFGFLTIASIRLYMKCKGTRVGQTTFEMNTHQRFHNEP